MCALLFVGLLMICDKIFRPVVPAHTSEKNAEEACLSMEGNEYLHTCEKIKKTFVYSPSDGTFASPRWGF